MRAAATAFGVPERQPEDADLIVDALFGSGFRGRLEGASEALVARANGLAAPIVALDVPSGVDGGTGRVEGTAIKAALTLAFHGRTLGTAIEPGRGCAGRVVELAIGLPGALAGPARALRMEPADLGLAPGRSATGSKYDAGGVLVVGGSPGMSGAPALAALAALRAGAGVVWASVPESERAAVAAHAPELMVHGELDAERVLELAAAPAPSSSGQASAVPPAPPRSSMRWCAAWRRRSCSMPTPCTRSPSGSRPCATVSGRRH
jgi:NAD(P)H-hydrate epimerase